MLSDKMLDDIGITINFCFEILTMDLEAMTNYKKLFFRKLITSCSGVFYVISWNTKSIYHYTTNASCQTYQYQPCINNLLFSFFFIIIHHSKICIYHIHSTQNRMHAQLNSFRSENISSYIRRKIKLTFILVHIPLIPFYYSISLILLSLYFLTYSIRFFFSIAPYLFIYMCVYVSIDKYVDNRYSWHHFHIIFCLIFANSNCSRVGTIVPWWKTRKVWFVT